MDSTASGQRSKGASARVVRAPAPQASRWPGQPGRVIDCSMGRALESGWRKGRAETAKGEAAALHREGGSPLADDRCQSQQVDTTAVGAQHAKAEFADLGDFVALGQVA